ncbi:MAG: deoxyribonuclease IV [Firmicutes bacterium]|nr:deoxyribonuclease IV [Bacillota bacterium]
MEKSFYIGCHLSATKGFAAMGKDAVKIGANTFAFFTRNPRGGKAKDIDPEDAKALLEIMEKEGFGKLVAHAPYTLNPCSATEKTREFAKMAMTDDLARMEYLPGNYYNFHPGSHVGQGAEKGIEMIADLLNEVMTPEQTTTVLLETMAGKGSEVGGTFEEIAAIIDRVQLKDKIGVCLDTCHVSDGGYNIVKDLDGVLDEFDRIVGLDRLKALHINDSKNPMGAKKDRHACIGDGYLGTETIVKVLSHPKLQDLPCILETPQEDLEGYGQEIEMLKGAVKL